MNGGISMFNNSNSLERNTQIPTQQERDDMLRTVKQYGGALQFAHEDFQKDKEVVLRAFLQDKESIQYAKGEFATEAFQKNPCFGIEEFSQGRSEEHQQRLGFLWGKHSIFKNVSFTFDDMKIEDREPPKKKVKK